MSRRTLMLLLFLLALLPRAGRLWQTRAAAPAGDAIEYESLGHSLATGQGYQSQGGHPLIVARAPAPTAFRTPGLPLFIAAHYAVLGGRAPLAPRVTLVLLNALAAAALFLALQRAAAPAPLLAALAFALWPESLTSFYQNDLLLAESLALPLLCLLLLLYSDPRRSRHLLAGLCLGALILVRAYLFLLPALMMALALLWRRRDLLRRAALIGAVAALVVAPWSLRNQRAFGRVVPLSTQQGVSLWCGWHEGARGSWSATWYREPPLQRILAQQPRLAELPEPERSAAFAAAARRALRERGLVGNGVLLLRKWALFASPLDVEGFHPSLLLTLPLALWGGLRALRRGLRPAPIADPGPDALTALAAQQLLLALAATALLVVGVIFMDQRFRYIALPATLAFAADGAAALYGRLRGPKPALEPRHVL